MNLLKIGEYRLLSQQIAGTKFKTAVEIIAWLGAVQAQEYAQTKWGLGLRLPHLIDDEVEQDFIEGRILRTHLLRPTWHLVTAQDIRWLLMLTAPRVQVANAYMYRKLELNTLLFHRCNNILMNILQGGQELTRVAIHQEFKRNKIFAEGHRLSYIMMQAELEGIVCSGARQGNQFTYALLDERAPVHKTKEKDEALAELTTRYFKSRGPATIKDFSIWSNLTLEDCKKGLAMVQPHFNKVKIDNQEFIFAEYASTDKKQDQDIYLLPIYDEFLIGYKDSRKVAFVFQNSLSPKPELQFDNTIVSAGQVIGTWRRTIKAKYIDLQYDFFEPLTESQLNSFQNALDRLSGFHKLAIPAHGSGP